MRLTQTRSAEEAILPQFRVGAPRAPRYLAGIILVALSCWGSFQQHVPRLYEKMRHRSLIRQRIGKYVQLGTFRDYRVELLSVVSNKR